MSEFLSISDLIKNVVSRLPSNAKIPSEATVRYAFAPANMHSRTSMYYTGIVNLKHAIQRRQLRAFHTDAHYCNALYRYMREMAIRYREESVFLSCDEKSKINYGEPGNIISSEVRGKINCTRKFCLDALDHDLQSKG